MSLKKNIIYLYFKGKHLITSKSQYQYNHGQCLYFADLNLPQAFEVHFSNKDRGESKTQIGSNKLVEIPDEYFWSGALQIYAWVYLHSGTDDGETIYEVKIPLIKRAKPTDEEPLPQQQGVIDRAIAELNNAIEITTENANKTNADKTIVNNIKDEVVVLKDEIDSTATTINQKAQEAIAASERAETSAQNAATSENKALNYSQQAEQSAQSALESKNVAQQKSEVATNASNEALGYRNEALEAKTQAVQAKQNIVDYRNETKEYRDETLNLKNNVQTLKNQIDETAEEIKDISDTVKEDAQSASQSASSASQSSTNASQFASQAKKSADDAEELANQVEQNKNQTETFKNQSEEYKTQAETFKSQSETFKNQAEQFKNQSETNVSHYPKIVNDYWYVWDATNGEYINTNVDANGIKGDTGNGIASVALNDDYTLTITFTDDTTYTTSSIRGQQGEKGDTGKTGESGVYIGTEEPENEDIKVWIDTDDDGTSEDLVKEIDELKRNIYKPYAVDSASGAIASFVDGADGIPLKSLVVDINPVQDLHGYDSPWVGGGGKNKCFLNAETITKPSWYRGGWLGVSLNSYNGITQTRGYLEGSAGGFVVSGLSEGDWTISFDYDSSQEYVYCGVYYTIDGTVNNELKSPSSQMYFSGSRAYMTVSIPQNQWVIFRPTYRSMTDAYDLNNIQVEKGSTATDYAPYENICPISGWTGMEIQHTKKNLLPLNIWNGINYNSAVGAVFTPTMSNRSWTQNADSISYTTTSTYTNLNLMSPLLPKGTYWLSVHKFSSGTLRYTRYALDKNYTIKMSTYSANITNNSAVVTLDEDGYIAVRLDNGSTASQTVEITIQLEIGNTETSYEPYNGRTIPISWQTEAGTVYGGSLDVLSGVLTVTHGIDLFKNLTWTYQSANTRFYSASLIGQIKAPTNNANVVNAISESYKVNSFSAYADKQFSVSTSGGLFLKDSSYTDVSSFVGAMGDYRVCYELATPIEIQLTPHEVNSLLGTNNIFADTGDTHAEYRADTKLYINKKITEAISALT